MLQIAMIPSRPIPVSEASYANRRFISEASFGSQESPVDFDVGKLFSSWILNIGGRVKHSDHIFLLDLRQKGCLHFYIYGLLEMSDEHFQIKNRWPGFSSQHGFNGSFSSSVYLSSNEVLVSLNSSTDNKSFFLLVASG